MVKQSREFEMGFVAGRNTSVASLYFGAPSVGFMNPQPLTSVSRSLQPALFHLSEANHFSELTARQGTHSSSKDLSS